MNRMNGWDLRDDFFFFVIERLVGTKQKGCEKFAWIVLDFGF
jgi:hypothetical protein